MSNQPIPRGRQARINLESDTATKPRTFSTGKSTERRSRATKTARSAKQGNQIDSNKKIKLWQNTKTGNLTQAPKHALVRSTYASDKTIF